MADIAQQAGSILIGVSALLSLTVVATHQALARWERTAAGRHVFVFEAVLALSLTLWALRVLIPDGAWYLAARLGASALVPVVLVWRLIVIVQTWRRMRRQRQHGEAL